MKWRSLKDDKPKGSHWVVLFNPAIYNDSENIAIAVTTSNPYYARANALKSGYTHWCEIPYPLPVNRKRTR